MHFCGSSPEPDTLRSMVWQVDKMDIKWWLQSQAHQQHAHVHIRSGPEGQSQFNGSGG
ncbi:CRISPR-associated endonuclease Cas9, partial [Clarias magur]